MEVVPGEQAGEGLSALHGLLQSQDFLGCVVYIPLGSTWACKPSPQHTEQMPGWMDTGGTQCWQGMWQMCGKWFITAPGMDGRGRKEGKVQDRQSWLHWT